MILTIYIFGETLAFFLQQLLLQSITYFINPFLSIQFSIVFKQKSRLLLSSWFLWLYNNFNLNGMIFKRLPEIFQIDWSCEIFKWWTHYNWFFLGCVEKWHEYAPIDFLNTYDLQRTVSLHNPHFVLFSSSSSSPVDNTDFSDFLFLTSHISRPWLLASHLNYI